MSCCRSPRCRTSRFPTISVTGPVARRRSADDGLVGRDAAREAVRSNPLSDADDVDEFARLHADHAAIRAERRHQCRGDSWCRRRSTRRRASCRRTCRPRRPTTRPIRRTRRSWCLASPPTRCRLPRWTITPRAFWSRSSRRCRVSGSSASAASSTRRFASSSIPAQLAANGLDLEDVRTALTNVSVDQPKGSLYGSDPLQHAADQRSDPEAGRTGTTRSSPIAMADRSGSPMSARPSSDRRTRR